MSTSFLAKLGGVMAVVSSAEVYAPGAIAEEEYGTQWKGFLSRFNKSYGGEEGMRRFDIFKANLDSIAKHNAAYNAGDTTWFMGVTQFTDLTGEEFISARLSSKMPKREPSARVHKWGGEAMADSVDWRQKGAVTQVKDQGGCGSCWAFSTVAGLEGMHFLHNGTLVDLSPQQLLDCDHVCDPSGENCDLGCDGGLMDNALQYVATNGGIATLQCYKYTEDTGTTCKADTCEQLAAVANHTDVAPTVQDLQSALNLQPVSVAVDADQSWQMYFGGVYAWPCGTDLDHGVTAVGYGTDSGDDYWLIKNSWGDMWGEDGYIRILKDSSDECGVLLNACYPNAAN